MKITIYGIFQFAMLVLALVFLFQGEPIGGASLAAFIPLMPRGMAGMGLPRPMISRAIRLNDGTFGKSAGDNGEELDYPLHDRFFLSNNAAVLPLNGFKLFTETVGGTRQAAQLTMADTNLPKADSIPSSQKWELWEMEMNYQAIAARDDAGIQAILNVFRTMVFTFVIDSKAEMFKFPAWKLFGGLQLISAPAVTVNSRFPQPMFAAKHAFKIPIVLESLTDFFLQVDFTAAPAAALNGDFIGIVFDRRLIRNN